MAYRIGLNQIVYIGPLTASIPQQAGDMLLFVDTSAGPVNLTLPTPTFGVPTRFTFRDRAGTFQTNNLTITPPGAANINGGNVAFVVSSQYPHIVAESDGGNYFI